ncbi:MAG: hypothetical protein AB7F22_22145 [Reyranella sp.]|uniref:hypothetical protein n=1 Tax=Reyranella sp. TaxID=1929291 RepID=UPI003D13DA02
MRAALFAIAGLGLAPAIALAADPSCRDQAGAEQTARYVAQCLEVSPATRPPCNEANPCALIVDEIKRGCALLTSGAPDFCKTYPRR